MILKNMFLCDAVSSHPDNTFSVLRGGINRYNITLPDNPNHPLLPIKIALVATMELEITEMGKLHNLEVVLLDIDGNKVIPELRTNFQPSTSPHKGYHNIMLDMFIPIRKPGEYCFRINVDGHELGDLPFYVVSQKSQ